jgi:hypothetical protein
MHGRAPFAHAMHQQELPDGPAGHRRDVVLIRRRIAEQDADLDVADDKPEETPERRIVG